MILKSLTELKHFHHARRIGMRLRIELTLSVFEKGLRRRDFSGMVIEDGDEEEGERERAASTGRVVGLISDDTNRVLRMVSFFISFFEVVS